MKSIILCADDYGQSDEISEGIIELIARQRLSATSCMTNMPDWASHGAVLKALPQHFAVGLHFNLTHGRSLTAAEELGGNSDLPSLFQLLCNTHFRKLNSEVIRAELNAQLDQFIDVMGKLPDFIDGHQHVHQFPVIRDTLINIYQQRFAEHPAYIRQVSTPYSQGPFKLKRFVLNWTGAKTLEKKLQQYKIPHNSSFSGIYDFNPKRNYRDLFKLFCQCVANNGLIMCHPGIESQDKSDDIHHTRFQEYHYFASDDFKEDCAAFQIELVSLYTPLGER